MARGYPDYFGQSIWPKYGTIFRAADVHDIASSDTLDMNTISVVGVLVSARVRITGTASLSGLIVGIAIDGNLHDQIDYDTLIAESVDAVNCGILRVVMDDRESFIFQLSVDREVPFHDSIYFQVSNGTAASIHADVRTSYYKVQ